MRVTDKMNHKQILTNIQKNRSELAKLQNQAATGKQLTTLSDDPISAARVLANRSEIKNLEQFDRNINYAKTFMDTTESTLGQLSESLVRARELALQGASDTVGEMQRGIIGTEISQIYDSIVEMSNRKLGDRYLFGGFKTQTEPFSRQGEYSGDDGEIKIQNQQGSFVAINLAGNRVFFGRGISESEYQKPPEETPKDVDQLQNFKLGENDREWDNRQFEEREFSNENSRAPASTSGPHAVENRSAKSNQLDEKGINLFYLLKDLEIALKTNDKAGIQNSLEPLTQALNQVSVVRTELGGRLSQLNASADSIQKSIIDNKTVNSQLEDADVFQTMTELSKTDNALRTAMETSAKMMNLSLMDYLK